MVSSEVTTEDLAAISVPEGAINCSAQRQPDEDVEKNHSKDIVDEQISSPTSFDLDSDPMFSARMLKNLTEWMDDFRVRGVVSGNQERYQTQPQPRPQPQRAEGTRIPSQYPRDRGAGRGQQTRAVHEPPV